MMSSLREARLRRDLNNVVTQVDDLLTTVGDAGSQTLQSLRDKMTTAAGTARDKLSTLDSSVRDNARVAAKYTDDYVHDKPWQVIGIVAAVGLLIGYLTSRRY
ncbi:MAG TPA: DUF883 family protein, partial [Burkholderiaceae bacterium]|nr:DUF883 family protein [Burkholderiaceae bacterium]